jgi:hypothetical protein
MLGFEKVLQMIEKMLQTIEKVSQMIEKVLQMIEKDRKAILSVNMTSKIMDLAPGCQSGHISGCSKYLIFL